MKGADPSRRDFLATAAIGMSVLGSTTAAWGQPAGVRVRRNVGTLDLSKPQDKKVLDQYAAGVQILRQRSEANPNDMRGWFVQAGLHTYRCQHGSWWFLPWHRAYLLYFERMIQDAVQDPSFALPYWDWTDSAQLALPAAFRDSSSPLHDALRVAGVDNGSEQLDWSAYDPFGGLLAYILGRPSFVPSFGSPAESSFPGLERTHGQDLGHGDLEGGPHDSVHVWIGGIDPATGSGNRDMGDPTYAALDPIFWLHHCNIDRLWSRWRAADPANHRNPSDSTWSTQQFEFIRPDGQTELIAVSQVVNSWAAPLGYSYDDETGPPPAEPAILAANPRREAPRAMNMNMNMNAEQPSGELAVAEPRYAIGAEPLTVALPVNPPSHEAIAHALVRPANQPAARVTLEIQGISFEGATGVVEVYLTSTPPKPGGAPDKSTIAGTFTLFAGHSHAAAMDRAAPPPLTPPLGPQAAAAAQAQGPARVTRVIDITDFVRKQMAAGQWKPGQLHVTLVRRALHKKAPQPADQGKVTFSRVVLRTVPAY